MWYEEFRKSGYLTVVTAIRIHTCLFCHRPAPKPMPVCNPVFATVVLALLLGNVLSFQQPPRFLASVVRPAAPASNLKKTTSQSVFQPSPVAYGRSLVSQRTQPLRDLFGLGPTEIAVSVLVAFLLFGPETLKSLSKDVGRAAAELKEIPKTFKEGMEEGAETSQVAKMKAIAAEKRKKRDEKLATAGGTDDDADDDDAGTDA